MRSNHFLCPAFALSQLLSILDPCTYPSRKVASTSPHSLTSSTTRCECTWTRTMAIPCYATDGDCVSESEGCIHESVFLSFDYSSTTITKRDIDNHSPQQATIAEPQYSSLWKYLNIDSSILFPTSTPQRRSYELVRVPLVPIGQLQLHYLTVSPWLPVHVNVQLIGHEKPAKYPRVPSSQMQTL